MTVYCTSFLIHSTDNPPKALDIAHNDPAYRDLLPHFAAVAFMGTPHGGSDVAFWTSFGARLLHAMSLGTRTNKDLLKSLRKDSHFLGLLSQKFAVQSNALRILSFYETEKFPMMNCRVSSTPRILMESHEVLVIHSHCKDRRERVCSSTAPK